MRQFYFSPSVWFGGEYDGSAPRVEYSPTCRTNPLYQNKGMCGPSFLGIIGEAVFFSTRCGLPTRWGGVGGEPC
jgi:hypothetical protein